MVLNCDNPKSEVETGSKKVYVALLDNSFLFRSLLRHILMDILKTDYEIVDFATPDSFLEVLPEQPFQILIADIELMDSIKSFAEAVKEQSPHIHTMAFTSVDCKATICAALKLGFSSYLLKESGIDQITSAIEHFIAGGAYIDPKIAHLLVQAIRESIDCKELPYFDRNLTPREKEICAYAFKGLTNKEIANTLVIAKSTVDNHFINLYRKLGITKRTQLLAFQAGQAVIYNQN